MVNYIEIDQLGEKLTRMCYTFKNGWLLRMGKLKTNAELINKIQTLRKKGYSLPEITQLAKVPRTTVFRYSKDVDILPEYKDNWRIKRGGSKKRKLIKEQKALEEAKRTIKKLSYKEKLLFLSALYWAEGSKKDFGLSNTDPGLIKVFVNCLRELLKIDDNRFRVSIRLYGDLDRDKSLSFWSGITGIRKENFIGFNILPGRKNGKLEYGMCRVRISKGGDILKKINAINKIVLERLAPIA